MVPFASYPQQVVQRVPQVVQSRVKNSQMVPKGARMKFNWCHMAAKIVELGVDSGAIGEIHGSDGGYLEI